MFLVLRGQTGGEAKSEQVHHLLLNNEAPIL